MLNLVRDRARSQLKNRAEDRYYRRRPRLFPRLTPSYQPAATRDDAAPVELVEEARSKSKWKKSGRLILCLTRTGVTPLRPPKAASAARLSQRIPRGSRQDWETSFRAIPEPRRACVRDSSGSFRAAAPRPARVDRDNARMDRRAGQRVGDWDGDPSKTSDVLFPTPKGRRRASEMDTSATLSTRRSPETGRERDPHVDQKSDSCWCTTGLLPDPMGDVHPRRLSTQFYGVPPIRGARTPPRSPRGRVAIVIAPLRADGLGRGIKAEKVGGGGGGGGAEHGAVRGGGNFFFLCLLFDPARRWLTSRVDVSPAVPLRPSDGASAASREWIWAGVPRANPLTPGVGATKDAKRLALKDGHDAHQVPVMAVLTADAPAIGLAAMKRASGGQPLGARRLPITYHIGTGDAQVHLKLLQLGHGRRSTSDRAHSGSPFPR